MSADRIRELEGDNQRLRERVAALEEELLRPNLTELPAQIPDNIMVLDRDERIRFINWTVPSLTVAQVLGTRPYDYIPPEHRASVKECYRRTLRTGEPGWIAMDYVAPDQSVVRFESRVTPLIRGNQITGVIVVSTNVTERDAAAADRDRLFELSQDLLVVATTAGYFTRVNPAAVRALGWPETELLARPLVDLVHPADRAATITALATLRDGARRLELENRVRRADGAYRTLHWNAAAHPEFDRIYAVARDVTEQRALELRLRQSQKMEAVGQLAGGIAHDFNNLLLAIMLNVELARPLADHPRLVESLAEIRGAADRAVDLTRRLLTFSRREPVQLESVAVNERADFIAPMLRRTIPESIELVIESPDELPRISASAAQIDQILMNLCLNARDALPRGGRITVRTDAVVVDESTAWGSPGRYVRLTVADDGEGMSSSVRERIFEPFFTTKAQGQGTGLGLAIVYGIVDSHAGHIDVHSTPGVGTTFELYFRVSTTAPVLPRREPAVRLAGRGETILVAEDSPTLRRVVVELLERFQYRVVTAGCGREAVAAADTHGDRVALALLDVVMPGMSGPEAAARIRASHPAIRILFTSGYGEPEVLGDVDPAAVLAKPYQPEDLLARLRRELDPP